MDCKDDEEDPPGTSHWEHKRKHTPDSPDIVHKKTKVDTFQSERPRENLLPNMIAAVSDVEVCSSNTDAGSAPVDEDNESTDSECDIDQPTLLEQLKNILDKYQDIQIIRELVQNADDANATKMKIIYVNDNCETTEKDNGYYSDYFRAPALCVYNNAIFSKQDWKYVRSIYNSGKRENALKVGRFGLGFKSVFHLTDNPVIISCDRAMIIDPFRTRKGFGNDCQVLTFKKLRKSVNQKNHYKQARTAMESVYGHFGFTQRSLENNYLGTLFWFPLRQCPSDLSTKILDLSDVSELIAVFKKEAACLPLFLKNISHVSFSDQDKKLTSFSVDCDVMEKEKKKHFNNELNRCKGVSPSDNMKAIFRVNITVFCFLPLPNTHENCTGLPLHVNGFFALSEDRHHVKWPMDDQTERVDKAQKWNQLLCEEVLAEAYADTVEYVKCIPKEQQYITNIVYRILPSKLNVQQNWDVLLNPLYIHLKDSAIFHTDNKGGKWITAKDAIFSILQWRGDGLESSTLEQTEQCVFDLLLKYKCNVVRLPSHVAERFPDVPRITPPYMRKVIREGQIYCTLSIQQKLLLLQFILSDRLYSDLTDLQLLPLEDNTFTTFDKGNPVYLCTLHEMKMFPGTEKNFIKLDLPKQIGDHLREILKSDLFNLRSLNKEDFPNLLIDTLTANGKVETSGCFRPTSHNITMEWLDCVWEYIGREYDTSDRLERLHVVPVLKDSGSDHTLLELMPLKGHYVVSNCEGMAPLDQNLQSALGKLPITVLEFITKGETRTQLIGIYCKYPNLEGLLELLEDIYEDSKENEISLEVIMRPFNDQSNPKEKEALLNFLSHGCLSCGACNVIRELLIFPETTNESIISEYTSIAKNKRIACENTIPVKYPSPLLHLDNKQKILAKGLGAMEVSETELVENILQVMTDTTVLYDRPDIEQFMMYVMNFCSRFSSRNDLNLIVKLGSRIKFVELSPASNETDLAFIRDFYDHTNPSLQKLFHFDQSKFLPEKYRKEGLESVLRRFGLKTDTAVKDVISVVKILDRECQRANLTNAEQIRHCSLQVMEILDNMDSNIPLDNLDLNRYQWITFIDKKPLYYPDVLPWYGDKCESLLCAPHDACSSKYAPLGASVKCVVEASSYPHLSERYGWNHPPNIEVCFGQLEKLRDVFCIKHKAKLSGIIKDIYQQLSLEINKLQDENLKFNAFVCTGNGFHTAGDVFISFPMDENIHLEPYMYKLPEEFLEFSELFVKLGSTKEHNLQSLKTILTTIKTNTTVSTSATDRQIAVNILKMIVMLKDDIDNLDEVLVPIQSENDDLELCLVKECTFPDSDSSWLLDEEEDNDIRYVHSDVSGDLAQSLGVQSFTQRFLSDGGTDPLISECGQSEPLTTRLQHLLKDYPDGLAVLKELVQNADDAGAQHIYFLYDERQNENATTGLIDQKMAKCQGPAFWAFNDAKFTDNDFENIVKLGGETKKESKTKIGKFGLGFNAVYNLTDVPSFVSGHSLVIFDPNATHLGKAIKNKNSPGIRLNFTKKSSGMLKRMKNQFLPYNKIFQCDLSGGTMPPYFDGTLFRFPLRTRQQAVDSAITSKPYCKDRMLKLLHHFQDYAGALLTFTQNLKEIKLFHLRDGSLNPACDMQPVFSTKRAVIGAYPIFNNPADINVMTRTANACKNSESFAYIEMISVEICTSENELLDVRKGSSKTSSWLVSWASGTTLAILQQMVNLEKDGALPLGSIAISLKSIQSQLTSVPFPQEEKMLGFHDKSHFFCFLPLPIECKTPFHINGCFAVSSDRKGLVKSTSDENVETEKQLWNRMLMSDAVCNANIFLLKSLEHFNVALNRVYSTLWPTNVDSLDESSYLADAFCKAVVNEGHRVFYTLEGRWASFRESIFLDNTLRHDNIVGDFAFQTFEKLFDGENIPMDMPASLHHRFITAGCGEELTKQTMTMYSFYKDIVFTGIHRIDEEVRDALIMHILVTNDNQLQSLLMSYPCIPVLPDGELRLPRDLVRPRPQSVLSELFSEDDGRFPYDRNKPFCSEINLDALVRLGMMDRKLPDELVVERAESVSQLDDQEQAIRRCRKLLEYIDGEKDQCKRLLNYLSKTAFIPCLPKPKNWPLSWCSNRNPKRSFSSPNQLFFPELIERIACSQLIVDINHLKGNFDVQLILKLLGVRKEELHKDVEAQLYAISQVHAPLSDKQKARLHEICISVYDYFDRSPEKLADTYNDLPIIWVYDRLVPPSRATTEKFPRIDSKPEIYQIDSADVTCYKTFLLYVGVQEKLCKENVIQALERVNKEDGKHVEPENVHLIVSLLDLLAAVCIRRGSTLNPDDKSRIYIPDDKNILRLAGELCVDDEYPLQRQKYMYFINAKVSGEIVKLLGVKSKRLKHLNAIKGSMPFGQKEELVTRLKGILEGYPRDETILYELLQNADDAGAREILFIKDMRQHDTKKGIFGESWADIQGPALCVFNDSCFTAEDLRGICKLGQGSKSNDPTKTGQFGVGFNAVYHLTDVPSFITRGPSTPNSGTFCAFDPNCTFCPTANELDPGLQVPDLKELEETYPGVYSCYLQKELPQRQGTWFRLPLRTPKMSKVSRICKTVIDHSKLDELLCQFQQNMKKCLLFLRSVRHISLCEIDGQGNITINHNAESTLEKNREHDLSKFCNACDILTKDIFARSSLQDTQKRTIQYSVTIQENQQKPERWIIAQTFGLESDTQVPDSVQEEFKSKNINLAPKGAVALPCTLGSNKRVAQNLISNCAMVPSSIVLAEPPIHTSSIQDCIASSSSEETYSLSDDRNNNGQIFCFLPLPLSSGLPVHINGHFALHQTRGAMFEKKTWKGDWNSLLFEAIISHSYVLAIEYMRDTLFLDSEGQTADIKSILKTYHDAFPQYNQGKTDLIKNMISSFFSLLYKRESTVFPVLSPVKKPIWWVGLRETNHAFPAFFDNLRCQLRDDAQTTIKNQRKVFVHFEKKKEEEMIRQAEDEAYQLSHTLKDIGMKILESPFWIYQSMLNALECLEKMRITHDRCENRFMRNGHLINPSIILGILRKTVDMSPDACFLKDVNRNIADTSIKSMSNIICLLRYLLKDVHAFVDNMQNLPLLVTNDGMLRRFTSTRSVFLSEFCDLLPTSSEKFVHIDITDLLLCIGERGKFLRKLDLASFFRMLPDYVNKASLSQPAPITWHHDKINVRWIQRFWTYVDSLNPNPKDIKTLENWCLVPGELKNAQNGDQKTEILVPCNKSYLLLNFSSFENELRKILQLLEIPTPHSSISSRTLRNLVTSKQHPVHFIQCLHHYKDQVRRLSTGQCNILLQYLLENVTSLNEPWILCQLKKIPLFTTLSGESVDLPDHRQIYVVEMSHTLPTGGLRIWSEKRGITLLGYTFFLKELMSRLGHDNISITDLYSKLILPGFRDLNQKHHLLHLQYVRSILKVSDSCSLKGALLTSAFIFHEGVFKLARDFYSPHIQILKKFCNKLLLPPDPFDKQEWKMFMEFAGMKKIVTADLYYEFATQIEKKGLTLGMTEEIKAQSKQLVKFLFDTHELSSDKDLLERIKNIKFVVPYCVEQEYSEIYPQFRYEQLISFCGSIPSYLFHVVWTTKCILPDFAVDKYPFSAALGIQLTPPVKDVLSHTHNVCYELNKRLREQKRNGNRSLSEKNIKNLMEKIYAYLETIDVDKSEYKEMLSVTPLVHLVDLGIFVTAEQVSISFGRNKQIPPYLVEIPLYYGRYKELFLSVGATETVTIAQYSDVLYSIKNEVQSAVLGPQQMQLVFSALTELMALLEETSMAIIKESMTTVETLFLPCLEKTLAPSTDLVFVDKQKLKTRVTLGTDIQLNFMHKLRDCNENEELILKLPDRLKPKVLSSIVQERLISRSQHEPDEKVDLLRRFVVSSKFLKAVKKIGKFEEIDSCRQRLLSICFVSVAEINTILLIDGRRIQGTEDTQHCFYDDEHDEKKFYIASSTQQIRNWLRKIGQQLFGMLSMCFEERISPEKIREMFDFLEDPEGFKSYCEDLLNEENEEEDTMLYHPGQLVPNGLHALLKNDIADLGVGDLVAYETFDPAIDVDENTAELNDASLGAAYIFVRIIQKLPIAEQDQLFQKYNVNFGQDNEKVVLGIRLYIVTYPGPSTSKELVLHQFGHDKSRLYNKCKIFDQIIVTLSNAWKLDDSDRKRVVKRLLLLWHPDKNRSQSNEYETFCKEVTQFILDIIRRLEKGERFDVPYYREHYEGKTRRRRKETYDCNTDGQRNRGYDNWHYGEEKFEKWQRFRDHISSKYTENLSRCWSFSAHEMRYFPDPQPAEAKRWFRQASMDFRNGVNSLEYRNSKEGTDTYCEDYNWICFKFHQACEKACKAYMYSIDAKKVTTRSHYLPSIIPSKAGNELIAVLTDIENLVGNYSKMRYPDVLEYPRLPADLYTKDQVNKLKDLTESVMEMIENRV
ncbi:sacsin-like [Ylistrum balloti]|uniref:sacsin-like n=1 Tax=Ylistrum balloti TaxID=509963 RepID=UPI00290584AD|nr:sacsin-like [Ylistrum balloti]